MFWINWIKGFLQTLNADTSPDEVARAFVLGASIGLLPKSNLSAFLIFLFTWVIRVNLGIVFLAIGLFSILGHFSDPFTEKIGFWLLAEVPALKPLWTTLYNLPVLPYFSFNNTLVLGNLVLALLLAWPLFSIGRRGIVTYRARYKERVMRSRVMTLFQATRFYETYQKWMNR